MTRADIVARMERDGGMQFHYDARYFFRDDSRTGGVVCNVGIKFRPEGAPDEIFSDADAFARWREGRTPFDPTDLVIEISPPYLEPLAAD